MYRSTLTKNIAQKRFFSSARLLNKEVNNVTVIGGGQMVRPLKNEEKRPH